MRGEDVLLAVNVSEVVHRISYHIHLVLGGHLDTWLGGGRGSNQQPSELLPPSVMCVFLYTH